MKIDYGPEITGIQVGRLKSLRPILNEWRNLSNLQKWFFEKDATWWNNERASLSILAGAIWRSHGLVMEEFATEKLKESLIKSGRCDIMFRIGRKVFLGEAKQDWPLLTSTNFQTNISETKKAIAQACHESLHTNDSKAIHLGIVFITPRTHQKNEVVLDEYLKVYINALKAENNITLAWQFPKWARKIRSTVQGFESFIYPGAILAIKQAN